MSALLIENLTKTYANGMQALKGLSLEVAEGDFFALLGPNGAGKTTAIGVVTSLVNKTSGTVHVFDYSIDTDIELAKSQIGLVPQEINFNQFEKVFEIVVNQAGYYGIPRKLAKERAEIYLRRLSLWDKRDDISRNLSGGMKRRLMIARALVHEPRLLILDEPTAGVDIEIRRSMWKFLRQTNKEGTTIILTTHYLEEAENLCRTVAIIDGGRIIEHDRMDKILRKLSVETFLLSMKDSITSPPRIEGFDIRRVDDHTLEVDISKDRSLNRLFSGLTNANLEVVSLRNKSNRLEELFMRLVETQATQKESNPGV